MDEGRARAEALKKMQQKGLLTLPEWESRLNKMWDDVKDQIADELMDNMPRKNPIFMMSESGARGNKQNFTQLAGMRGLMARPVTVNPHRRVCSLHHRGPHLLLLP